MQQGTDAFTEHLLADLNEPQRQAVRHVEGPLLILAGPGSGKTRVVTRRAAYLAATVARPYQILAITFTNKASREMRERIDALGVGEGMTVATFHAFCARLLRIHSDRAGISRNFTIFDTDDRRKLIKKAIEACDLSTTNWSPAAVEAVISSAKNDMLTADDYASGNLDWQQQSYARIFLCYEQLLQKMNGVDFDDLLCRVARLIQADSELCEILEQQYKYMLIDEYQDTNAAQYAIARQLTKTHHNICATGDPDQSIYGWRGADISNILNFERDFKDATIVRLEQNYRSTQRILSAADVLIASNSQRKEKTLWTENDEGPAVVVMEHESGDDEARAIVREIASRIREGTPAREIGILYRVNALSRSLEEAFLREGIPYSIARGVEFYNRREIKDVLAYARILVNPTDDIALNRIINTPTRGIGTTTINRLNEQAKLYELSALEALYRENVLSELGRSASKVRAFGALLQTLQPAMTLPASQAMEYIMSHTGIRAMYRKEDVVDEMPLANLDELINAAASFEREHEGATLVDWLEHAALISDVDIVSNASGAVTLLTLHAAKGLEFDVVYIVGLEDGLLPFRRHEDAGVDEEEERRLCFVGMTRARKRLTLSRARYRMRRGITERTVKSPFLDELPRVEIEWARSEGDAPRRPSADRDRLPDDIEQWEIGSIVRHPVLGLGSIAMIHQHPRQTRVDVKFRDGSERSWILEFADLQRVDFDEIGDAF